ncbi:hypothetical protein T02_13703 [Trichinella nativa]|uniref:Uncharacterized protein n=1 Tax=Trichinella nativa TaxID=6335 RepID=A0A0V1L232_9BILA|nr:hypothetical protein T06_11039 [Trichinella sp. T6]KRZ53620.1 hypothetical protein T02_13703 [Trichinella nativa]KRZ90503.1 hypothetical protein T08_2 [Trichinella sp. T8]
MQNSNSNKHIASNNFLVNSSGKRRHVSTQGIVATLGIYVQFLQILECKSICTRDHSCIILNSKFANSVVNV